VANLLNPCKCKSVWKCRCSSSSNSNIVSQQVNSSVATTPQCCDGGSAPHDTPHSEESIGSGSRMRTRSGPSYREQKLLADMPCTQSSDARPLRLSIPTSSLREISPEPHNNMLILPPFVSLCDEPDNAHLQSLPSISKVCPPTLDTGGDSVNVLARCGCGSTCVCPGCQE
jgi:hypothetical protein